MTEEQKTGANALLAFYIGYYFEHGKEPGIQCMCDWITASHTLDKTVKECIAK